MALWNGQPIRARRIRATLEAAKHLVDMQLSGGPAVIESYEIVEESRQAFNGEGCLVTLPPRVRAVWVVSFFATPGSFNGSLSFEGVIKGLGGSTEEL